jgi:hypothetical protein
MSMYEISDLPDDFQRVMQRIVDLLSQEVVIESFDDEWVHFSFRGLADHRAIITLEGKHHEVLPGRDLFDFQILCPWSGAQGRGLWLHYLPESEAPDDYRPGVWFY